MRFCWGLHLSPLAGRGRLGPRVLPSASPRAGSAERVRGRASEIPSPFEADIQWADFGGGNNNNNNGFFGGNGGLFAANPVAPFLTPTTKPEPGVNW